MLASKESKIPVTTYFPLLVAANPYNTLAELTTSVWTNCPPGGVKKPLDGMSAGSGGLRESWTSLARTWWWKRATNYKRGKTYNQWHARDNIPVTCAGQHTSDMHGKRYKSLTWAEKHLSADMRGKTCNQRHARVTCYRGRAREKKLPGTYLEKYITKDKPRKKTSIQLLMWLTLQWRHWFA